MTLAEVLIPKLELRFPGRGLKLGDDAGACAVFPPMHPAVGEISIYDDESELTLVAGNFTHGHFSNYDSDLSTSEKAEAIADAVVEFLEALFADNVVLWGSHQSSGGWYRRDCADEKGAQSVHVPGRTRELASEYVWSGPLVR